MLSKAERRANELAAVLSGYWAKADQAWLDALLKISDEASDADKSVIWLTCVEIAALRGWKWSHVEGQWKRATGVAAVPDSAQHEKAAKSPPGPLQPSEQANSGDSVAGK